MDNQNELLQAGLKALDGRVSYGDIRIVHYDEEWIDVDAGKVDSVKRQDSRGFGVRVLRNGAWGYAGSRELTLASVVRATEVAIAIAEGNPQRGYTTQLSELPPQIGHYETPVQRDYFDVPLDEKVDLLIRASNAMNTDPRVVASKACVHGINRFTWLASTEGSRVTQRHSLCGGGISTTAAEGNQVQTRSYPMGAEGDIHAAGWEFIERLDLLGEADRVRDEALALLSAPECPTGRRTLILDGAQLSLQIHESCGHPIELDRALGEEISLAGCSFLRPEMLNELKYGSQKVNIYADSTSAEGPGSFGWDDEGVPASRWDIVRDGQFVGYLGSRETATRLPGVVPGSMRADSWARLPIVRMVNVNLEPGSSTLDEMIASTDDGVFMSVNRSWSIDDFRLNFQFSCEAGWEIKAGKITRMVRNPVYTGITPKFWNSCDAIANTDEWRMWGWRFCGKGDPMQLMHVGHGCAPARFQDVEIRSSHAG